MRKQGLQCFFVVVKYIVLWKLETSFSHDSELVFREHGLKVPLRHTNSSNGNTLYICKTVGIINRKLEVKYIIYIDIRFIHFKMLHCFFYITIKKKYKRPEANKLLTFPTYIWSIYLDSVHCLTFERTIFGKTHYCLPYTSLKELEHDYYHHRAEL